MHALSARAFAGLVVDDVVMIELDARLHHERDHARPGRFESRGDKSLAMRLDRGQRGLAGS